MHKINFITSNQGKMKALENSLKLHNLNIKISCKNLEITEPQFDTVHEVSKYKALKAYECLKEPVLVEDGGLSIFALKGFPGVYTKYIIKTLGADGILKLLTGVKNRTARFISVTTFVDNNGKVFQFEREGGEFEISNQKVDIDSPFAWSELWKIIYLKEYQKNLCQLSKAPAIKTASFFFTFIKTHIILCQTKKLEIGMNGKITFHLLYFLLAILFSFADVSVS